MPIAERVASHRIPECHQQWCVFTYSQVLTETSIDSAVETLRLPATMGFSEKKFIELIRKDRLHLVQAYVDKYGSSIVRAALDKRGRTAFHLSCRHASVYSFNYFLKRKPNLTKTDRDGNLAIHWAVTASKKGQRYAYNDIILPLLRMCPDLRDIPNKKGVTARKLLIELGLDPENIGSNWENNEGNKYDSEDDECYNSEASDERENGWQDRLFDELQDDCNDTWGRYETDHSGSWNHEQPESFDSWASRMSTEYDDKFRSSRCNSRNASMKGRTNDNCHQNASRTSSNQQESKSAKFDTTHPSVEAKLSQHRCSLIQRKCKFMLKYARLFENQTNVTIRIDDLPWIGIAISPEEILSMLLADIDPTDFAAQKKCLREQQRTWHPDKFLQKYGSCLGPNDKDSIIAEVNKFSQTINATLDNISPI